MFTSSRTWVRGEQSDPEDLEMFYNKNDMKEERGNKLIRIRFKCSLTYTNCSSVELMRFFKGNADITM